MEQVRKPFHGVRNIIGFNWHLYVLSFFFIAVLLLLISYAGELAQPYSNILLALVIASVIISLSVSCYIYDFSGLYKLSWLSLDNENNIEQIVNIHAGFDETSVLLEKKYCNAQITALDFYDPQKHTEPSIKRARAVYAPYPGTIRVKTDYLQLADDFAELVFVALSAHEIRNPDERVLFFAETARIVKPGGKIIVTEHLRDMVNFLAYNIGCLHFHSRKSWLAAFQASGLEVKEEIKITPFITTFVLEKYGTAS